MSQSSMPSPEELSLIHICIPAHAVELKKNREGIGPVSRTRDNEQTAAALGNSEILGIEESPRDCPLGAKHTTSARPPSLSSLSPVSYTHLDVYKRQTQWRARRTVI